VIPTPSAAEVERFKELIAFRLGLDFDETKLGFLADILQRRTALRDEPGATYLARLGDRTSASPELRELARELTVGETYFFRHFDQFSACADVALRERAAARATTKQLRLLSAGCASGDEAYSLAILLREHGIDASWDVSIRAIDINPTILAKAKAGIYSAWSLRETPEDLRKRWFVHAGSEYRLNESLRGTVTFSENSLTEEDPQVWAEGSYDIVFCRNVLMYFTLENAQRAVARIARSMTPGGYLFLGHAETLRGLSQDFHLQHSHRTFYYTRKGQHELSVSAPLSTKATAPRARYSIVEDANWSATWMETVERTSERIRLLAERGPATAAQPNAPANTTRADLSSALELLGHERFGAALDVLQQLPPGSAPDPDALLLEAALLTHSGKLPAAERACEELLKLDEFSAGAHYLLALCCERKGDGEGAVEHDQIAVYLDPTFAMPRLHLGLMARRSGDRKGALRELSQAALLLPREEAARLMLFGGGFSRDGLLNLCRSELGRLGATA
jgi:chemotaxis protein methyltransferase CheR